MAAMTPPFSDVDEVDTARICVFVIAIAELDSEELDEDLVDDEDDEPTLELEDVKSNHHLT